MQRQQSIVQGIYILEVILRVPVCVFGLNAHIIVQNAVHADVLKADFVLDSGKLPLPVRA